MVKIKSFNNFEIRYSSYKRVNMFESLPFMCTLLGASFLSSLIVVCFCELYDKEYSFLTLFLMFLICFLGIGFILSIIPRHSIYHDSFIKKAIKLKENEISIEIKDGKYKVKWFNLNKNNYDYVSLGYFVGEKVFIKEGFNLCKDKPLYILFDCTTKKCVAMVYNK